MVMITNADDSCVVYCRLSVCLIVRKISLNSKQRGLPNLPRNAIVARRVLAIHLFWIQNSKVKLTSHKNNNGMGLCTLVSAGFF